METEGGGQVKEASLEVDLTCGLIEFPQLIPPWAQANEARKLLEDSSKHK